MPASAAWLGPWVGLDGVRQRRGVLERGRRCRFGKRWGEDTPAALTARQSAAGSAKMRADASAAMLACVQLGRRVSKGVCRRALGERWVRERWLGQRREWGVEGEGVVVVKTHRQAGCHRADEAAVEGRAPRRRSIGARCGSAGVVCVFVFVCMARRGWGGAVWRAGALLFGTGVITRPAGAGSCCLALHAKAVFRLQHAHGPSLFSLTGSYTASLGLVDKYTCGRRWIVRESWQSKRAV